MNKWNDKLELGIGFIDRAHKEIFDMFDRLVNQKDSLDEQLLNLLIHFKYYFADEESLLLDISFPEYDHHKNEHNTLINDLEEILNDLLKANKNSLSCEKINSILDTYFLHILKEDSKIKNHFFYP